MWTLRRAAATNLIFINAGSLACSRETGRDCMQMAVAATWAAEFERHEGQTMS